MSILKDPKKLAITLGAVFAVVIGVVVVATVIGGEKTEAPSSLTDLAAFLSSEGEGSYEVKGDIAVPQLMYVNGNKKLTGTGTITAQEGVGEYIIVINDSSSLTVDGVTMNGNGVAGNGVYVSSLGRFVMESGSVCNVPGHGIRVLGELQIKGGSVSAVGTNWLMVDELATADIAKGSFSDCGEAGILTGLGSKVTLGKEVSLSASGSSLVYNAGDMTVKGGSYTDSGSYTFHNEGTLDITDTDLTGAVALGYFENMSEGTVTVNGGSMKDSKADFIFNQGTFTATKTVMDGSRSTAIESRGASSLLTLTDCSIENVGKNAILAKSGKVTVENLKIGECGACGINSRGAEVTGKNVTIVSAGDVGIYNNSVSDSDATVGNMTLDGFEIGTAKSYVIRTNGGIMKLSDGKVGKGDSYGLYVKNGKVTTDHVDFLGTNDEGRCVIQVGLSKTPAGELIMKNSTVTGGAKGITNHGTLHFESGKIYGNKSTGTATGAGVYNTGTFTMTGGEISGNSAYGSGGGVSNSDGSFTITGGLITGNASGKYGGGIYNSGNFTMNGGTVTGNSCASGGGGVEVTGTATLNAGRITSNYSASGGGGVYVGSKGAVTLSGVLIADNSTDNGKSGGGVAVNGGKCTVLDGTVIRDNYSSANGGGISSYGEVVIHGGSIIDNTAVKNGGGVGNGNYTNDDGYTYQGTFTMDGGEISGNTASGSGGGISNVNGVYSLSASTVSGNSSGKYGGGIYNSGTLTMNGVSVVGNRAVSGGGGVENTGSVTISGGSVSSNVSENGGGGVYIGSSGEVTLSGTNVNGNRSSNGKSGGGVSVNGGKCTVLAGTTISGNYSDSNGGGIYNYGQLVIHGGSIVNNTAAKNGGGIGNSTYTNDSGTAYTGSLVMDGGVIGSNSAAKNGGGIYNAGTLQATGGSVSSNSAELGGGVYTNNTSTIIASVSKNKTSSNGGGIYVGSSEKAVVTLGGSVSDNTCGSGCMGAGIYNEGAVSLSSGASVTGNGASDTLGGGIYNNSDLTLASAVSVSGNHGATGANICNNGNFGVSGLQNLTELYLKTSTYVTLNSVLSSGSSLEVTMETFTPGYYVVKSDVSSAVAAAVNGSMITLTNNSGLDAGDQLAVNKEFGYLDETATGPQAKLKLTGEGYKEGKLSELIALAGTDGYTKNITLLRNCVVSEALAPTGSLSIDGDGNAIHFINENCGLTLKGTGNVLKNITFRTSTPLLGSTVSIASAVEAVITDCTFDACKSQQSGGAIYSGGKLTVTGTVFTGCTTDKSGGAVYVSKDSTASFKNVTATGGKAGNYGGDIYVGTASDPDTTPVTFAGKNLVDELYLAADRYVTASGTADSDSSIGIKVAKSRFVAGTKLVDSCSKKFAATVKLLNDPDGTAGIYLNNEGVLVSSMEAALYQEGSFVKNGNLTEMLSEASVGDDIRLISDAYLTKAVSISGGVRLSGEYALILTGKDAGITFTSGESNVSDVKVGLKSGVSGYLGPVFAATGSTELTVSGVTFTDITSAENGFAVKAEDSAKLTVSGCSFDGCIGSGVNALAALESSTLTMSSTAFSDHSAFEMGKKFTVTGTTICEPVTLTAYPASDSSAALSVEKYTAGTKLYSWTMTDSKTEEQLTEAFAGITLANGTSGSSLSVRLIPASRMALLIADTEAILSDAEGHEIARGMLKDILTNTSLDNGCSVKLISNAVLDSGIELVKAVTIDGDGYSVNLITAEAGLTAATTGIHLKNLNVTSNAILNGSALLVKKDAIVTASGCTFTGISSSAAGAAVYVEKEGRLNATNSDFTNNASAENGGAIYNEGAVSMGSAVLTGNTAEGKYGGAIYNVGSLTVMSSTLSTNKVANYGGGLYNTGDGVVTLMNDSFTGNTSGNTGGDIYNRAVMNVSGKLTIEDLFLYGGFHTTLTGDLDSKSAITVEVQSSKFVGGTIVMDCVSGITETQLANAVECITLANNAGKSEALITVTLGKDGVLDEDDTVELLDGEGAHVAYGTLLGMLTQAQDGYTVRLNKGAGLSESFTLGCSIILDTNGNVLRLSSASAEITVPSGCTLSADNAVISSPFGAGIINHGTLSLDNATLTGCPVTSDGTVTSAGLTADSTLTLAGSANLTVTAGKSILLTDDLGEGSAIRVTTDSYAAGTVIVASDIADTVTNNIEKFTLVNNLKADKVTPKSNPRLLLDTTGVLVENPGFVPEAKLLATDSPESDVLDAQCALADAIDAAIDGNMIVLLDNVSDQDIAVGKDITLDLGGFTLSGTGTGSVVSVSSTVTIQNGAITMPGTSACSVNGGGIINTGTLTLNNVTVTECSTSGNGGGIYNNGSSAGVTLGSGTTVSSCSAAKGAGIYNNKGTVNVNDGAAISDCTSTGDGGGIYTNGTLNVTTGASIIDNTASGNGGGIYQVGGTSTFSGGNVSGNADKSTQSKDIYITSGSTADISAGTYGIVHSYTSGSATTVTISGGDFTTASRGKSSSASTYPAVAVSGGRFIYEPTSPIIKSGYEVKTISDQAPYTVQVVRKPTMATVSYGTVSTECSSWDEIKTAVLAAGSTHVDVVFAMDVSSSSRIELRDGTSSRDITLNLNGHSWTYTGSTGGFFIINNGTSLTVYGGEFISSNAAYFFGNSGSSINVTGGTYTGASSIKPSSSSTTLSITGGTFNVDPTTYVDTDAYTVTENSPSTGLYTVTEKTSPESIPNIPSVEEEKEQPDVMELGDPAAIPSADEMSLSVKDEPTEDKDEPVPSEPDDLSPDVAESQT